ncbi:MAG: sugar phosphate isomerase [Verrucomicrobiales bacterium]|nr:sugar phosphate isomerase [Verrucomicrobiales bacterium]
MPIPLSIPIGTVIRPGADLAASFASYPEGLECYQLAWPLKHCGVVPELEAAAEAVKAAAADRGGRISALGVYGNPLRQDEAGEVARDGLRRALLAARSYGAEVVGCFAGRVPWTPVPDSLPRFREVFSEFARMAEGEGVKLAFEHCLQGGNWERGETNMAFHPAAWEMMFDAVPSDALGLEWEPCHLMCQLIEPLAVLDRFAARIHHVHGKDGKIDRAILDRSGTHGPEHAVRHRFPGLGDTDWTVIIARLRAAGYQGVIDIEGGHDPIFRGDREMEGQANALAYLRRCRDAAERP